MAIPVALRALVAATLVAVAGLSPAAGAPDTSGTPGVDGRPLCGAETAPADRPAAPPDGKLRVASLNVLHSDTDLGDQTLGARLELAADTLAASGADVVGAQEVTKNEAHGTVAQRLARALAARTGERWEWCWFLSNPHAPGEPDVQVGGGGPLSEEMAASGNFPDPGDFREGLAILSRFPITAARSRRLTPRTYEAPACVPPDPLACSLPAVFDARQVLWARVDSGDGLLDVFDTHIAHELTEASPATKLLQVEQVLAVIGQWAAADRVPDVLTGDFNSTPDTDRYAAVVNAGFVDTYAAALAPACDPGRGQRGGCTSDQAVLTDQPVATATERIDYVFAKPGQCGLRVPASAVIGTNPQRRPDGKWLWPSDHLGVVSELACAAAAATPTRATPVAGAGDDTGAPATLPATGGAQGALGAVTLVGAAVLVRLVRRR